MENKGENTIFGLVSFIYSFVTNPQLSFAILIGLIILLFCVGSIKDEDDDTEELIQKLNINNEYVNETLSFMFMSVGLFVAMVVSIYNIIMLF